MGKNIYVGNLPFDFSEDDLNSLFSRYGSVTSARIIKDAYSGRSRGFGFVEMSSDEEAYSAIEKLNKSQVGGREIVVNEARERRERPRKDFRSERGPKGRRSRY